MRRLTLTALAGPLALARNAPLLAGLLIVLTVLLTLVTQIGGLVLWLCIPAFAWLNRRLGNHSPALRIAGCVGIFAGAYLGASLAAIPLAGAFGRVPLACDLIGGAAYEPRTIWTCLLNRHYVTLPARLALQRIGASFSADVKDIRIAYLDAGFPFFDWFPMLPHISHGDGRKIDLALIHAGSRKTPSPIGYWGFVQPRPGGPQPCVGREGWLRWNMTWLQPFIPRIALDDQRTAALLRALARDESVRRILIEPHLKRRLRLEYPKIRFQGCRAARHDDHIHVEFAAN